MSDPALRELDPDDRPRERLLRDGAHTLGSAELLALVLGTGRGGGEDALQLARRVLHEIGGIEALGASTLGALQSIKGIGPVKAARIRSAFELALRSGPVEPHTVAPPPIDPVEALVADLRGQVPTGEKAVLGFRPHADDAPITLDLGAGLGARSRPGSFLARMLTEGIGPWWVVAIRPGGKPRAAERDVAERLDAAARVVGLDLERILLVGGRRHWLLVGGAS